LIDREEFAHIRPACPIYQATRFFCQARAGKKQVAARAALTAGPFTNGSLLLNIRLLKMNQYESPNFAASVIQKPGLLKNCTDSSERAMKKCSQASCIVKPTLGIWDHHWHHNSSHGIDFIFPKMQPVNFGSTDELVFDAISMCADFTGSAQYRGLPSVEIGGYQLAGTVQFPNSPKP
jgi:hypothetical protein